MAKRKQEKITSFDFTEGRILNRKYRVIEKLGSGTEGEVYHVQELDTGIERAAKIFFPHKNIRNKVANGYARKLEKLADCPIIINYHTQESFWHRNHRVTCLIFEYIEGEMLSTYIDRQPGKRMNVFNGILLLYALAEGLEDVHRLGEYHGDLHTDNIMVSRYGIGYEVKLIDMYDWKDSKSANRVEDINKLIRVFYDALGGKKHYAKQPVEVKNICLGLRRDLINKKFRTISLLRDHIENIDWETPGY